MVPDLLCTGNVLDSLYRNLHDPLQHQDVVKDDALVRSGCVIILTVTAWDEQITPACSVST